MPLLESYDVSVCETPSGCLCDRFLDQLPVAAPSFKDETPAS
jgi:hypothetical protein